MKRYALLLIPIVAAPSIVFSANYVVEADGSGDFPFIQPAVDAAENGDVIELGNGTFVGAGNRDVDLMGKALTIRSQSGDPSSCMIDCEGTPSENHRGFVFSTAEPSTTTLEGITITGGYQSSANGGAVLVEGTGAMPTISNCVFDGNRGQLGGAVACINGASPTIADCIFRDNNADRGAGLVTFQAGSPTITNCEFLDNTAARGGAAYVNLNVFPVFTACLFRGNVATGPEISGNGGAIHCTNASVRLELFRCTFVDNQATSSTGGGLFCQDATAEVDQCTFIGNSASAGGAGIACKLGPDVSVDRTIIAHSVVGEAVLCDDGDVVLDCSDLFDNAGGDWIGGIEGQENLSGNIAADPDFCDVAGGFYAIPSSSPCAPFSDPNPSCDRIGAWGVGCGVDPTVNTSWGAIKHGLR